MHTSGTSSLRIVVTGLVGLHPVGGVAWDYLQYVIGLRRLGHDVYYFESTLDWPYHPLKQTAVETGDYSAQYLNDFFARYAPDCLDRWCYFHLQKEAFGMSRRAIDEVLESADVFINLSAANPLPDNLSADCVKVFLDTDPGYNQIVMSQQGSWFNGFAAAHDRHCTYAENIYGDDCRVPRLGYDWITTRMPVVLDLWEPIAKTPARDGMPWSTVMTWNAFKQPLVFEGTEYFSKGAEFERVIDLPQRCGLPLKVAVGGKDVPRARLRDNGWSVEDGPSATLTPETYQRFIADSRGELSTAKNVYAAMRSGWFSCRTACYLAAGRPAVVQDTGFSRYIDANGGLLPFRDADDALLALQEVEAHYADHARLARDVAETYFSSDGVLSRLLDDVYAQPGAQMNSQTAAPDRGGVGRVGT